MNEGGVVRWQRAVLVCDQHAKLCAAENDTIAALILERLNGVFVIGDTGFGDDAVGKFLKDNPAQLFLGLSVRQNRRHASRLSQSVDEIGLGHRISGAEQTGLLTPVFLKLRAARVDNV